MSWYSLINLQNNNELTAFLKLFHFENANTELAATTMYSGIFAIVQ